VNERASERGSPPHREHALHSKIFDLNNLWEFMYVSDERARHTHIQKKRKVRTVCTSIVAARHMGVSKCVRECGEVVVRFCIHRDK
jgi:hypothetical protein